MDIRKISYLRIRSVVVSSHLNAYAHKVGCIHKNHFENTDFQPLKKHRNDNPIFSKKRHQEKLKKKAEKFCGFEKTPYLCTRNLKMECKCKHHSM